MLDVSSSGKRIRRKSVSDVSSLIVMATPSKDETYHKRQKSASEGVTKLHHTGQMKNFDLNMAEEVVEFGTRKQRRESGYLEKEFVENIEEKGYDFDFNHEGLNSEDAARLLESHGRNELPEKVDPKWLIFLRQFWAPMPIMIWYVIGLLSLDIIEMTLCSHICFNQKACNNR